MRKLLFCVLIGICLARLRIPFPSDLETASFGRQVFDNIQYALANVNIVLERMGLAEDSANFLQSFGDSMSPPLNKTVERRTIADVPVVISRKVTESSSRKTKQKALVYLHGGGFVFGSAVSHYPWTSLLTDKADVVVISVDYRRAPRHPFPAGLEDCLKVTKTVFDSADELNIDRNRIAIAGDSAGGNLATMVALELAKSEKYRLKAQILLSGMCLAPGILPLRSPTTYSYIFSIPSDWFLIKYAGQPYTKAAENVVLSRKYIPYEETKNVAAQLARIDLAKLPKEIQRFVKDREYLNIEDSGIDEATFEKLPGEVKEAAKLALNPRAWPLLVHDDKLLSKLPPTLQQIAEYDVMRDEEILYYARLANAGVPITLSYLPNAEHTQPIMNAILQTSTKAGQKGVDDVVSFIKETL